MGPRSAGTPLISSRRSGRKTLTRGRWGASSSRTRRRRRTCVWVPGCEADRELVLVRLVTSGDDHTRGGRRSGRAHVRWRYGTKGRCNRSRWPRADSSCRRRSGPRSRSGRRPPGRRALVSAEVADLDGEDLHRLERSGLDVQPDRHDQVEEAAAVAGLEQSRTQRAYQLQTTSPSSIASRPSRRNSGLKPISRGSPWKATGSASWASPTYGV